MKYLLIALLLVGCTSKTEFGDCVGLQEDRDPRLIYKADTGNIVIGILFFEMVAPPLYVALDEFYCPVGRVENKEKK